LARIDRIKPKSDAQRIENALANTIAHGDLGRTIGEHALVIQWHGFARRSCVAAQQPSEPGVLLFCLKIFERITWVNERLPSSLQQFQTKNEG
jgi:hypothetical protein